MGFVRLTYRDTITADVVIQDYSAALPSLRRYATLRFWMPRYTGSGRNPAWSPLYLSTDEPFRVEYRDGRAGYLPGVAMSAAVDEDGGGITVEVVHVAKLWDRFRVRVGGAAWEAITPGAVVRSGAYEALAGRGMASLALGTFVEAPPLVTEEHNGQPFGDLVNAMMDVSGQEPEVAEGYVLNWRPPRGRFVPGVFLSGGRIHGAGIASNFENMATTITGILPNGETHTARL